jgi:asparagine synthase (glutamine-hydrolysing)
MCGISGMFSARGRVSVDRLEKSTRALRHRGPDNQRHWVSADGRVGLGHSRLSIIDLAGGDQPIANEDGQLQIIANGEFYDFERIRQELEERGHVFRTKSDSEIALHLYEEQGVHCLEKLRGEFAFAIWDEKSQRLFVARDRFGIKPLYYAVLEGTLYFASEVKALIALGVPARWNHDYFYQLATGPATPDGTLFEGVFQLPPGYFLLASNGSVKLHQYWELNYCPAAELAKSQRSEESWVEEFRHVFEEAVRLRMRADVPVGCYLSGGIDSCAVLGFAARNSATPIEAFTLTFDQDEYNEGPIAAEMAALAGANFHPIPIKQSDIAEHFSDAVFHSEALFWNGHSVSKFLLSRAVRDAGFKVVYTGEGSDEILGGYVHFRSDMLQHNTAGQDPAEVARLLKELTAANAVSRGILLPEGQSNTLQSVQRALGFIPGCFQVWDAGGARRRSLFAEEFQQRYAARDSARLFLDALDIPGVLNGRDPLNKSLFVWAKSFLPNYILNFLGDRMEMAHSIEGRVPFLDHHVVEFLGRVPVSLKIRGLTEKYLLREAARPFITDTVYRRQKHPFMAPPATATRTERLHQLLQDTLRGPECASIPFYDQKKVTALLDFLPGMAPAECAAWDAPLMSILSACVLQQRFGLS